MPFWPFMMGGAAVLTLIGLRVGGWQAPALALLGYAAMRGVIAFAPVAWYEVAACTLWLSIAALMMYKGAWVPGFFYALSGMTYPALLLLGFRLEYLGLSPVVSEAFAICALASIGGGLYGMAGDNRGASGPLDWLSAHSLGVAARQG